MGGGHFLSRIRNLGHYTRSELKMNVVMAAKSDYNKINDGIEGSVTHP